MKCARPSTRFLAFLIAMCALPSLTARAQTPAQAAVLQQPTTQLIVQPAQALIPIGQEQSFQLLSPDGGEDSSGNWTVSDPKIAEVKIVHGRAIVKGKSAGEVTLYNSNGAQAEMIVHDGKPPMPAESRWILRPLDGRLIAAFWASSSWAGDDEELVSNRSTFAAIPAYFYNDIGPRSAHVRAITAGGLQAWQWPMSGSDPSLRTLCGDMLGGVVVVTGQGQAREVIDIDRRGQERWRAPAPGFDNRDFAFNATGMFYFTEELPNLNGARIIGLDAKTGAQKFTFEIPPARNVLRGFTVSRGALLCTPGTEFGYNSLLFHSGMITRVSGVTTLAYSQFNQVSEAAKCTPGDVVTPDHIHVQTAQRLMLVEILEDRTSRETPLEENTTSGQANSAVVRATVPTGDIIPGEDGNGNFIAVRKTTAGWVPSTNGVIKEFQYRINDDRTVKYRVQVPSAPFAGRSSMLLGENDLGFTGHGNVVIAFDTKTGTELWRWTSPKGKVALYGAMKNDELLVRYGNSYAMLKDGKIEREIDENFLLFVMKLLPDWSRL